MATAPVFEANARNADKIRNASSIINVEDVLATLLWDQDMPGLQGEFGWGNPVGPGSGCAGPRARRRYGRPRRPKPWRIDRQSGTSPTGTGARPARSSP